MSRRTAILGYARTPFGKLLGGLGSLPATELGGHAIRAAVERAGLRPEQVEHVVFGQVLQAGAGQVPSMQAAMAAGLPVGTTSETINKVCASSHRAVQLGDIYIRAGEHEVVVAGGMESMTQAPFLSNAPRGGVKMGDLTFVDSMLRDGLVDPFDGNHMVVANSNVSKEKGVSRERQDAWAARSHQLASEHADHLAEEIAPVTIPGRKGDVVVDTDESVRADTTVEVLAKLRPVFTKDGSTTAGNAPGVNDGASAIVLASDTWVDANGATPLAWVRGHAYVAGESPYLMVHPATAVTKLLEREGLTIDDIDLLEVNEAFASVTLNVTDLLGIDPQKVNVNGGAIALGHPIGASGARIIGSLVLELRRRGGGLGIAAICSGGGQGDALLVEVPAP